MRLYDSYFPGKYMYTYISYNVNLPLQLRKYIMYIRPLIMYLADRLWDRTCIYIGMMHTKTSKNPITHSRLGNPTNNKIAYLLRSGQNVPKSCFRMIDPETLNYKITANRARSFKFILLS